MAGADATAAARHEAAKAIREAALALQQRAPGRRLTQAQIEAILEQHVGAGRDEVQALRRQVAQLKEALASRSTIEQAKGILMAAQHCTPDEAFESLVRLSQHRNVKVRDIAADLVDRTISQPRAH